MAVSLESLSLGPNVPIPELDPNKKKFNKMEPIIQEIQKVIGLPDDERKTHNKVMQQFINILIEEMQKVDPLFKSLFSKTIYGGSYYDGLKLYSPDEYDLDLALKLPKKFIAGIENSNETGFVRIKIDLDTIKRDTNKNYGALEKMVDSNHFILTQKFRSWFEGVLQKAKNNVSDSYSRQFTLKKSGPAMTLIISMGTKKICVDLVPAFIFNEKTDWPKIPFRPNPITLKNEFLVVPKDPPNSLPNNNSWRLSFQDQEREIILGKNGLKDTIRLIKLLRNRQFQEFSMASYFIKTVMMWFKDGVDDPNFWRNSRSYIFMMGLKYFSELLKMKKIPYYWNENYNLLIATKPSTIENWSRRIEVIIKDLERKIDGPFEDLESSLYRYLGVEGKKILENEPEKLYVVALPHFFKGGISDLFF